MLLESSHPVRVFMHEGSLDTKSIALKRGYGLSFSACLAEEGKGVQGD